MTLLTTTTYFTFTIKCFHYTKPFIQFGLILHYTDLPVFVQNIPSISFKFEF